MHISKNVTNDVFLRGLARKVNPPKVAPVSISNICDTTAELNSPMELPEHGPVAQPNGEGAFVVCQKYEEKDKTVSQYYNRYEKETIFNHL